VNLTVAARHLLPAAALVVAIAGCTTGVQPRVLVDGPPGGACVNEDLPDMLPFLQCPDAVTLAQSQLGLIHPPIVSIEFHRGALCPPNARCARFDDRGSVVFRFDNGGGVVVAVSLDERRRPVASAPEPIPDWLLAEPRP
jgi:hypothetical protein